MSNEPTGHSTDPSFQIHDASREDIPLILRFIRELAIYEKLEHEAVATAEQLESALFGPRPFAEVIIGRKEGEPVGFALFFHTFSTFLGRPGIYLEDLYVSENERGRGYGRALLARLAAIAIERGCGRLEWSVLDWNAPSIGFYRSLGAVPMEEWTVFRLTGERLQALGDSAISADRRGHS
jgi:GNAT superfamily N-acetyltransferase